MDRMTDSGSVGWAFESPRDHTAGCLKRAPFTFALTPPEVIQMYITDKKEAAHVETASV